MKQLLKRLFRAHTRRLGYGVFDLSKDHCPSVFLAGHLQTTFEALDINCVIDVGANCGQFASTTRRFFDGRLISIEPESGSYIALTECAQGDSEWHTMNIALGEKDENRILNVCANSDLSSFLRPSKHLSSNIKNSEVINTQRVTMRRLDSIFRDLVAGIEQPRVFLKLDTQGYDLQVLRGGFASMHSVIGLQSELSVVPLYEGIVDYLDALGFYRNLGFEPTGIFPVAYDRQSRHVLEFDAVLARRHVPERLRSSRVKVANYR
jgi:FkbM family methyltransferase